MTLHLVDAPPTMQSQLFGVAATLSHYDVDPVAISINDDGITLTLRDPDRDMIEHLTVAYGLTDVDLVGNELARYEGVTYDGIPVAVVLLRS